MTRSLLIKGNKGYNRHIMEPFKVEKPLIGMIHLSPLPGSYHYAGGGVRPIIDTALRDLDTLERGGADAGLVENLRDTPFAKYASKETFAAMTVVVQEVVRRASIPIGVNVLRNDGLASLSIAAATGACFLRINVYCGVAFTDQGPIEGEAHALLELRKRLGCNVNILADVLVKHASHLATVEQAALDTARNLPDALVVSGIGTGKRTAPDDLQVAKQSTSLPVLVGSGVRIDNLFTYGEADGFIVGSALKEEGEITAPVDLEHVRELAGAIARLRETD